MRRQNFFLVCAAVLGAGVIAGAQTSSPPLKQAAYMNASNAKTGDHFGNGGTLDDSSIPQAGAAYVFTRNGTTWSQQSYIKASNTGEAGVGDQFGDGDEFGFSIGLSADGNTLAVGAIGEDSGARGINGDQNDNSQLGSGAVYVFTRSGTTWSQQAYVTASNTDAADLFGYSVGLSADGNTLAASAYDEDGSSREINGVQDKGRRGSGAIYVFTRTGATWSQQAYLKASNEETGESLGYAIAISQDGNTIAGGAADEDCMMPGVFPGAPAVCDNDQPMDNSSGAVYVFVRNGTTWTQQAFIKSSNPGKEDWFGSRLTLSGDGNTLAAGAQVENGGSKGINGDQKDQSAEDTGAVYFFTRSGTTWIQTAYVKASNADPYDEFGSAMALSKDGKLMAAGARGEASAAKGVNGNQTDNSAPGSGAVYIFTYQ